MGSYIRLIHYEKPMENAVLTKRTWLSMFMASLVSTGAYAKIEITDEVQNTLKQAQTLVNKDNVVPLPISGLNAIEVDGQVHYISDNGRFVITGQIYDVLSQKFIDTFPDIKEAATKINFAKMGLDPNSLNTFSMGTGSKTVVVFVDPVCKICEQVYREAQKLEKDYTFKFVVVPAFGEASNALTKKLACTTDRKLGLEALKNGTVSDLEMPVPCDTTLNDKTLLTAHMLRIDGVPYVISPNGSIARGQVLNLKAWLEKN